MHDFIRLLPQVALERAALRGGRRGGPGGLPLRRLRRGRLAAGRLALARLDWAIVGDQNIDFLRFIFKV